MTGFGIPELILVVLALAFAWSIGAHYTGACMGMAYASGSIDRDRALWSMAALTVAGAVLASGRVVSNIGLNLVAASSLSVEAAAAAVGTAFLLTSIYNFVTIPTSTIQLFVFSLVGVASAEAIPVHWANVGGLVVLWVAAPLVALALGYLLTRAFDRGPTPVQGSGSGAPAPTGVRAVPWLVVVALGASFAMGANDVANATAVFVATNLTGVLVAGLVGGLALALGVVTWGRGLLSRVAFDIVRLDRRMASAAQLAQVLVILGAVVVAGAFTSMNQALVGGMAGAGLARGRSTIQRSTIQGILVGWAIGPASGFLAGFAVMKVVQALLGAG
jgi:inorganic phosphate transporter, PiT family